jgi:hypothetical protein
VALHEADHRRGGWVVQLRVPGPGVDRDLRGLVEPADHQQAVGAPGDELRAQQAIVWRRFPLGVVQPGEGLVQPPAPAVGVGQPQQGAAAPAGVTLGHDAPGQCLDLADQLGEALLVEGHERGRPDLRHERRQLLARRAVGRGRRPQHRLRLVGLLVGGEREGPALQAAGRQPGGGLGVPVVEGAPRGLGLLDALQPQQGFGVCEEGHRIVRQRRHRPGYRFGVAGARAGARTAAPVRRAERQVIDQRLGVEPGGDLVADERAAVARVEPGGDVAGGAFQLGGQLRDRPATDEQLGAGPAACRGAG